MGFVLETHPNPKGKQVCKLRKKATPAKEDGGQGTTAITGARNYTDEEDLVAPRYSCSLISQDAAVDTNQSWTRLFKKVKNI